VNNYDNRKIEIIGTDCKDKVYGSLFCKVYKIPKATDENYIEAVEEIYDKENINVMLPQNTAELEQLTHSKVNVAGRDYLANDKSLIMRTAEAIGIPYPKYFEVKNKQELFQALFELRNKRIVIKPTISNGSRGMRIIDDNLNYKKMFLEEKLHHYITVSQLSELLEDEFKPMLVMEYIEGYEYTVDCFRSKDRFVAIPRKRNEIKNGISWETSVEKNDELVEYSKKLAEALYLKFAFGFQFINNKIIECNPRVQGTMVASTLAGANLIYSAIKLALKEPIPEFNINWNSRIIRYSVCEEYNV
jgi:carbamoyl-phosphate synthase large subunit